MKKILLILLLLTANLNALSDNEKIDYAVKRSIQSLPFYSEQRVNKMLELETGKKLGILYFNIPGLKIKRYNQRIKNFTVDYGVAQINEINIVWTYEICKILREPISLKRNKKLVSAGYKYGVHRNLISDLLNKQIPPIKLKKIEPLQKEAYLDYLRIKNKNWKVILKELNEKYSYQELTINDIESSILYRILVEKDREARGWKIYI